MCELERFKQWVVNGKGTRTVEMKIGGPGEASLIKIWVYDFEIGEGQHIKSIDDINLEKKKHDEERKLYKKLRSKFEGNL